ncbi:hypothetical protein BCR34DRAFT_617886 [Clohesyomyces aquaticus]|uniref:MARVEL domain-containing protein n=1 Tax=Clohesyomyces aquaticus TaxID=1231657 RepID=A0A1Y1YYC0_9PLEO|nr:hypothetical protein BCR34DRAFT_617886 [Clohesyomyces aquaticus]
MAHDRSTRTSSSETGLLTRCVPARLKTSAFYRWTLLLTRVFQFLSAVISLGLFSFRLYKIYRLTNSVRALRNISNGNGAVEGILAAAVLYTLIAMIMGLLLKGGGPKWLRWLWVVLDFLFVGAFIAVSVLTSPNGGSAGPKHCYTNRNAQDTNNVTGTTVQKDNTCNLPWGTFILAIVSTILHAITAAFHEVHDHRRNAKIQKQHAVDGYAADRGYAAEGDMEQRPIRSGY